ncbi:MAG: hypothetical protein ACREPJ_03925 [Rhodanobacteraceae bacterium]
MDVVPKPYSRPGKNPNAAPGARHGRSQDRVNNERERTHAPTGDEAVHQRHVTPRRARFYGLIDVVAMDQVRQAITPQYVSAG